MQVGELPRRLELRVGRARFVWEAVDRWFPLGQLFTMATLGVRTDAWQNAGRFAMSVTAPG